MPHPTDIIAVWLASFAIFTSKQHNLKEIPAYDEKELLLRIAKEDEDAFRLLFHQWRDRLSAYLYRVTESRELTEDIVQEVFLKVWMSREGLAAVSHFKNYLFVIARNYALNELRRIANQFRREQEWNASYRQTPDSVPPSSIYGLDLVDQAVGQLSERQRTVWVLSRREGLTYEQIARQLDISRETVKTHLKSASVSITRFVESRLSLLVLLGALEKLF